MHLGQIIGADEPDKMHMGVARLQGGDGINRILRAEPGFFIADDEFRMRRKGARGRQTRMRRAGDHYFLAPVGARDRLSDASAEWVSTRAG